MSIRLLSADCREAMLNEGPFDCLIADPPYGDTSLGWDKRVIGWPEVAISRLKPTGSMWVFGSMRCFMETWSGFQSAGWRYAQEIIWEKHNGSGFQADRFKRVHEIAVQFYRADSPWSDVYNDVQKTHDAIKRSVPSKKAGPAHTGKIKQTAFASEDGGPRLMRSIIYMPSCHGHAIHPTEKPVGLLEILIRSSCPTGGLVGDFFAGSGAAGEACAHTGRRYVGTDSDSSMCDKARARLSANLFAA